MNTYEAIVSRRTIREFQDKKIPYDLLEKFVNAGRLAPQAANRQPLEFIIVDDEKLTDEFFKNTKLAGYMEWNPDISRKAQAYIVILANIDIQKPMWIPYDTALAAGNISLAAWAEGIGSCMIGAFNKNRVRELLQVPGNFEITLLVALGYPAHKAVVLDANGNDIAYWRDEDGTFHVPKRPLKKITHHNIYY